MYIYYENKFIYRSTLWYNLNFIYLTSINIKEKNEFIKQLELEAEDVILLYDNDDNSLYDY